LELRLLNLVDLNNYKIDYSLLWSEMAIAIIDFRAVGSQNWIQSAKAKVPTVADSCPVRQSALAAGSDTW
jgi:hypothetical protein